MAEVVPAQRRLPCARHDGLRLLSIDGGGVKGLAALLSLKKIMEQLKKEENDPCPRPCDHFDMMVGTSTGGLIVIMLGRLGMSVEECIEAYRLISEDVFILGTAEGWYRKLTPFGGKGKLRASYDHEKLEEHIKKLVARHLGGNPDAEMRDTRPGACKVAVVAMATENSEPQVLPSYYDSRNNMMEGMKIWEAARATSAATGFFEPIIIGPHKLKFVDGAIGANNPVKELWQQAQRQFPSDYDFTSRLGCLLSLGTGLPSQKEWTGNAISVGKRLMEIATDTRRTAEMFGEEHVNLSEDNRYVRLDPIDVGDLKLDAVEDLPTIARRTDSYLQKRPQWLQVLGIADHLRRLQSMS